MIEDYNWYTCLYYRIKKIFSIKKKKTKDIYIYIYRERERERERERITGDLVYVAMRIYWRFGYEIDFSQFWSKAK